MSVPIDDIREITRFMLEMVPCSIAGKNVKAWLDSDAEREWIPVGERLPGVNDECEVICDASLRYNFDGVPQWWALGDNVTHWRNLPAQGEGTE